MAKRFVKLVSALLVLILSFTVVLSAPVVSAKTDEERKKEIQAEINKLTNEKNKIQADINKLQNDINKQTQLKNAIESKIALVQKEIDLCNQQINLINDSISKNEAEIKANNKQIEADKLAFKKRLRAIYMSNSGSNVQVLLGADDFSQFLQLSQLTASVSARDKKMIEDLVSNIKILQEKQEQNNKLLEEQKAAKAVVAEKQNELSQQSNQIQSVIASINSDKKTAEQQKKEKENAIKLQQNEYDSIMNKLSGGSSLVNDGEFLWPTPTVRTISSKFGPRWGSFHDGIDISNGTFGGRIVAIADGKVEYQTYTCTHNYRKTGNIYWDRCGGGYGNYIIVDHGKGKDGKVYKAWYAHMSSVAVKKGQYVKKGQTLGYIGSTGYSTGPHLHFGVSINGIMSNPELLY